MPFAPPVKESEQQTQSQNGDKAAYYEANIVSQTP